MMSLRVCVSTTYSAEAEPRAPRHALALAGAGFDVLFVDTVPYGKTSHHLCRPDAGVVRESHRFPTKEQGIGNLAALRISQVVLRRAFRLGGWLHPLTFSVRAAGLRRVLEKSKAAAYFAHNIDALLPTALAAKRNGALLIFDCMEYYSDMGDGQNAAEARQIAEVERRWLPQCALVTASSPQLARVYEAEYGLRNVVSIYNAAPTVLELPCRTSTDGLRLYWRNSVIGFGQRGLEDVLNALLCLPQQVSLHLQGRLPTDGGSELAARIAQLGLAERVTILEPYMTGEAVRAAARFDVGLCLERDVNRNHRLTVSNKMFDYLMAGLAVVSSDLPSLKHVIDRSGGGLTFRAGNVDSLVEAISRLWNDRTLLATLASRARDFALREGNAENEMRKLINAVEGAVGAAALRGRHNDE